MKIQFALSVYVLLIASAVATAQQYPCIDPGMVFVGSFHATAQIEAQNGRSQVDWGVGVWRSAEGQYSLKIDVPSIQFSGDGVAVDGTSTFALFELMSKTSANQAASSGYVPCTVLCEQPTLTRVLAPGCVTRNGVGLATLFDQCEDIGCCVRVYSICCPTGQSSPVVTFISAEGPICPAGTCKSTCY